MSEKLLLFLLLELIIFFGIAFTAELLKEESFWCTEVCGLI